MTLYSADISKLAKPVKKLQDAHKKLAARKKREPEPVTEQVEVELEEKKRKTPAPKVAAKKPKVEKAKAPKRAKKVEEEEEEEVPKKKKVAKKLPTPEPTEDEEPKKAPRKRKAKAVPEKKSKPVCIGSIGNVESEEEKTPKKRMLSIGVDPALECFPQPKKRVRKAKQIEPLTKENLEPPQWFNKYVEGVKKEEAVQKAEKVPAKQVKQEAQEVAQKSWNDGLTRDRVSNEVDSHMNRMYSMIFKR